MPHIMSPAEHDNCAFGDFLSSVTASGAALRRWCSVFQQDENAFMNSQQHWTTSARLLSQETGTKSFALGFSGFGIAVTTLKPSRITATMLPLYCHDLLSFCDTPIDPFVTSHFQSVNLYFIFNTLAHHPLQPIDVIRLSAWQTFFVLISFRVFTHMPVF